MPNAEGEEVPALHFRGRRVFIERFGDVQDIYECKKDCAVFSQLLAELVMLAKNAGKMSNNRQLIIPGNN